MKRLAIILAAAVILLAGLLLIAPQFIPTDAARTRIAEQVEQWIGRPVSFDGEPVITLFPRPSVRLENVVIRDGSDSDEVFIQVDELVGTFRLLPIMFGRFEANSFELIRPMISLRVDDEFNTNWDFTGTLGDRVAEAQLTGEDAPEIDAGEISLGRFRIVDGTITFEEPGADLAMVSEVMLDLRWPSTAAPATATGSLVWRGEHVDFSAGLAEPLELIAGRRSPGEFAVRGEAIQMAFDGTVGRNGLDFVFNGETSVEMPSLRHVIGWAGADIGEGDTLADATIIGMAGWEWPILSFSDAEIDLDGNNARGAFAVDFSGERVEIVGTLALDHLDITPYTEAFLSALPADESWRDIGIHLPLFEHIDADIRISADRLSVGAPYIEGFAASAITSAGHITVQIAEADFYGGRFRGSLTADYTASLLRTEIEMSLTNVEAIDLLSDTVGVVPLSGRVTGTARLASEGANWGEIVRQLTGEFTATVLGGAMRGADLSPMFAATAPTVDTIAFGTGETAFNVLEAFFSIENGQIIADAVEVAGPGYSIAFTGFGSMLLPEIRGEGNVVLFGEEPSRTLPFVVTGTWLAPQFGNRVVPEEALP